MSAPTRQPALASTRGRRQSNSDDACRRTIRAGTVEVAPLARHARARIASMASNLTWTKTLDGADTYPELEAETQRA